MGVIPANLELFYDGQWQNQSAAFLVRDQSPITVSRGVGDQGGQVDPAQITATLDNTDGRWNIRDPAGPLYGKVTRGTPVRVSVGTPYLAATNADVNDTTSLVAPSVDAPAPGVLLCVWTYPSTGTFTAPGGMTADTGAFSSGGVSLRYARQVITAAGPTGTRTATISAAEDYIAASVLIPGPIGLTADIEREFHGSLSDATMEGNTGDYWVCAAVFISNETEPLEAPTPYVAEPSDSDGGGWFQLADSGDVEMGDAEASRLRLIVWAKRVRTTNTTHTISLSCVPAQSAMTCMTRIPAVEATPWLVRAVGELAEIVPGRDRSENNRTAELTATGYTKRVGAVHGGPVASPMRQHLTTPGTVFSSGAPRLTGYWPCEDPAGSLTLEAATPDTEPGTLAGEPQLASDTSMVGSLALPVLANGSFLRFIPPKVDSVPAEWHIACVAKFPATLPDQQQILTVWFEPPATLERIQLRYTTGGGLRAVGFQDSTVVGDTGTWAFDVNNRLVLLELELVDNGANVDVTIHKFRIRGVFDDASTFASTPTSFAGVQYGQAKKIIGGFSGNPDGLVLGHFGIAPEAIVTGFGDLRKAATAYYGERTRERFRRLCEDAAVAASMQDGAPGDESFTHDFEEWLGAQPIDNLMALLQEVATSDGGLLYEPRGCLALGFRTYNGLVNRTAVASFDRGGQHVADPWQMVYDDTFIRNDVTVANQSGGSYRAVRAAGTLNVGDPISDPDAVGAYPAQLDANLYNDFWLPHRGDWELNVGTSPRPRLAAVTALLHTWWEDNNALALQLADVEVGDWIEVTNVPDADPGGFTRHIVLGISETIGQSTWQMTLRGRPADPYLTGLRRPSATTIDPDSPSRRDTGGSELASGVTATATSLSVATTDGPIWGVTGDANMYFPLDIDVGGEQMRVTAISGAGSPQTFTVTRSVNTVAKAHAAGAAVRLWRPAIRGL